MAAGGVASGPAGAGEPSKPNRSASPTPDGGAAGDGPAPPRMSCNRSISAAAAGGAGAAMDAPTAGVVGAAPIVPAGEPIIDGPSPKTSLLRSFFEKAGMRSKTPDALESSLSSDEYSTDRCCSSRLIEVEYWASCLWMSARAGEPAAKRDVSFISALIVYSLVTMSAMGDRSTLASSSTTVVGAGCSPAPSGGGVFTRSSPYSPTHQTASWSRTGCVVLETRGAYSLCVAYACMSGLLVISAIIEQTVSSEVNDVETSSVWMIVSTCHSLSVAYFSTTEQMRCVSSSLNSTSQAIRYESSSLTSTLTFASFTSA